MAERRNAGGGETRGEQRQELLELAPEPRLEEEKEERQQGEQRRFWSKLKRGLLMTHTEILEKVAAATSGRAQLDEAALERLEEVLIGADLGVDTALALVARVKQNATREQAADPARLRKLLVDEMAGLLEEAPAARPPNPALVRRRRGRRAPGEALPPLLTLVAGVNGVGKTTSIAKLARLAQQRGERVLIAAADTFRAAAVEQLALWGERLGVDVIRQAAGADPAAVVYDAIKAAEARQIDQLLVDTAGRLHTKDHLMAELGKVRRVIDREAAGWLRQTLLVLDATTGQNALVQARTFSQVVPVDGLLLAKLDGTAKGGMAVAVARELGLPVLYLGVGESADDLVEFRSREFAAALLG
ncbi:MAG TPA: signal recognition particle-docking protein FtsY [Thermoanaerobaculia bacterium]|nr:signal recognition particle-docking protein FtsY [Thermoanaerobaculia bacterium]